ncbi:exopolyphosphatase [Mycobacterium tuberculosis]|nr:exopolyphosphatase [Mycobacterium tuberculosis]
MALTRVAAIDCGTNSIRLLIADVGAGLARGELHDVHRETRIVRLGQGVDATGRFAPEAIARTRTALTDYAELLTFHHAERVRMVATSAARDVVNRDVFFAMTADVLGAALPGSAAEVITGAEEAELSFRGAVGELGSAGAPFVVVDLGVNYSRHSSTLAPAGRGASSPMRPRASATTSATVSRADSAAASARRVPRRPHSITVTDARRMGAVPSALRSVS